MTTPMAKESQGIRQKQYRENKKKQGARPVTIIIKDVTHDRLRAIAKQRGLSQGEIIDRLLEEREGGAGEMSTGIDETLDRIQQNEFLAGETAIHTVGLMLGFLRTDIQEESGRSYPNQNKIADLRGELDGLLNMQRRIYHGDRSAMRDCMANYAPAVKERLDSVENARRAV